MFDKHEVVAKEISGQFLVRVLILKVYFFSLLVHQKAIDGVF